jgi:hypothetical protein
MAVIVSQKWWAGSWVKLSIGAGWQLRIHKGFGFSGWLRLSRKKTKNWTLKTEGLQIVAGYS